MEEQGKLVVVQEMPVLLDYYVIHQVYVLPVEDPASHVVPEMLVVVVFHATQVQIYANQPAVILDRHVAAVTYATFLPYWHVIVQISVFHVVL